jgi:hypothetical protein
MRGVVKLANVRRWFRTVVINVCLLFDAAAVVFTSTYFRFLLSYLDSIAGGCIRIGHHWSRVIRSLLSTAL